MQQIFKFENIFKSVLWGGERIAAFKGVRTDIEKIGESWELSPVKGSESVISNGEWKGRKITELISEDGSRVMGDRLLEQCGGKFPLLVKLIDSTDDLSVQVHPDDELASKRHSSLGKTEMWFSLEPIPDAYLYAGFKKAVDKARYKESIADGTLMDSLQKFHPKSGDLFFLPAGRIHSIGKGNLLLEIQQASDVTYRIYDYDRKDAAGNPRQLHVEESADAIDFDDLVGNEVPNFSSSVQGVVPMNSCKYFATALVTVKDEMTLDLASDSFNILVCTKGECEVTAASGETEKLSKGHTALVSADCHALRVSGEAQIVTAYVPVNK